MTATWSVPDSWRKPSGHTWRIWSNSPIKVSQPSWNVHSMNVDVDDVAALPDCSNGFSPARCLLRPLSALGILLHNQVGTVPNFEDWREKNSKPLATWAFLFNRMDASLMNWFPLSRNNRPVSLRCFPILRLLVIFLAAGSMYVQSYKLPADIIRMPNGFNCSWWNTHT